MHKLKTFVKSLTSQTSDKKQQSSSSGESVAVVKSEHDMHWGLARVALHTVPTDVNSIAYDGVQGILAIGTSTGLVHIYGKYGIDYTFYMRNDVIICSLEFAINQGWLIGICLRIVNNIEKYFLCVWSLKECALKHQIEMKNIKRITCTHAPIDSNYCYIGVENADGTSCVRSLHIAKGEISPTFFLRKPFIDPLSTHSTITCMETHPTIDHYLLVGYECGEVVLFNVLQHHIQNSAVVFRNEACSITCISWHPKKAFFFVGSSNGDIHLWNIDKKKEQQLETNASGLYNRPDLIFNHFKNTAAITDIYCMNSNVFVGTRSIAMSTDQPPTGGIYNLVFTAQWNAATTIKVCNGEIWKFKLLPMDTPHKSEIGNVAYGAVVTSNSVFRIFDLSLSTDAQTNVGFPVGNFLNDDNVIGDTSMKSAVADLCLLQGTMYVERVIRKRAAMNKKSTFPLFGGSLDLTYASAVTSHLLAVRYKDGSANLWGIKTDTGTLVKIFGLQNNDRQITGIKPWSNEVLILYSESSISFLNPRTMETFNLSLEMPDTYQQNEPMDSIDQSATSNTPEQPVLENEVEISQQQEVEEEVMVNQTVETVSVPKRNISYIAAAQHLNKLVVAYSDLHVDIIDLKSSTYSVQISYDLTIPTTPDAPTPVNNDVITIIEVALVRTEKAKNVQGVWVAFIGFASGRLVNINLEKSQKLGVDIRKDTDKCLSLDTVDLKLSAYPCVQPAETDVPYFVDAEMDSRHKHSDSNFTVTLPINNDIRSAGRQLYISPNLHLFSVEQQLGFVCPLVVEICLNDPGLQMLSGEINIQLETEEGHVLFWAEVHPLRVRVGHLPQDASSPADIVEVVFEYDLESVPLDKATKIVISHDIAQKKYRIYAGSDLAGIQTYEAEVPPNLSLHNVKVHVSGSAPPQYDSVQEYVQDYVQEVNLYYKKLVTIKDLQSGLNTPDVNCVWQNDFVKTAGYLVTLRPKTLQVFEIKSNKSLKLKSCVEQKAQSAPWICGRVAIIYEKMEYVTLSTSGMLHIYSLPQLALNMACSVLQPHILRGPAPSSFCVVDENHLVLASSETLVHVLIVHSDDTQNSVFDPILHVDIEMPRKQLRAVPLATHVNNVLGGLTQLTGFLFGPPPPAQKGPQQKQQQQPVVPVRASKYFDSKIEDLFAQSPTPVQQPDPQQSVQQQQSPDYEKFYFEKAGTRRKLFAPDQKPKPSPKQQIASSSNTTEQMKLEAKRAELLGTETSSYKQPKINEKINETKKLMSENLQKLDERGERLRSVETRTLDMSVEAKSFAAKTALLAKRNKSFGGLF